VLLGVCGSNGLLRVFDFDECLAAMQSRIGVRGDCDSDEKRTPCVGCPSCADSRSNRADCRDGR
jgi:hypothetical protein